MVKNITIAALLFIGSLAFAKAPDWTAVQNRTVIGGDIVYLGMGVSSSFEVATFKADNMAISRLVLECAIPHKEIKIWERYSEKLPDGQINSYSRASLKYEDCKTGKESSASKRINLTSDKIAAHQALYNRLLENELNGNKDQSLKDLTTEVIRVVQEESRRTNQKLDRLENKIDAIEAQPKTTNQILIHEEVNIHGSEADYRECIQDYNDLMSQATSEANSTSKPLGNLANGPARNIYNKAIRKKNSCDSMKKKSK